MTDRRVWHGERELPSYPSNLALMLNANAERFAERPIYQEVQDGAYVPLTWAEFRHDVTRIQTALSAHGLKRGERVAILSPNRREMLETELAIMSMGAVAVPIFAGYAPAAANALVEFCKPSMVVVADDTQYRKLATPDRYRLIVHFDALSVNGADNTMSLKSLMSSNDGSGRIVGEDVPAETVCLMMYTSGTMGKPKCVQLVHRNILSQQAAMHVLWQLDHTDRFLSYLPWHHSFGGIYEKYAALYNGAVLSLEHGYGKNIDVLLENWRRVRPTVFFSVPRIYQQMMTKVMQSEEVREAVFHDELRFVFTAAAPLPKSISDMFAQRGIPVYEGWGLTETSPCCTVTDPDVPREPGVVGKPIPGVSLQIADDGEILVKGPNVMKGYYNNPE
ncbi:MAG: hypothetical protein D6800_09280, partial [Candidatus Zixiibacteriota bacterium]